MTVQGDNGSRIGKVFYIKINTSTFLGSLRVYILILVHCEHTIDCCRDFEDVKDQIGSSLLKKLRIFLGKLFTEYATFGLKIYVIHVS